MLKTIQTRIQELEAKTKKTPRDEADLIHLQTRQQHILAAGKPVDVPAQATVMAPQPTVIKQLLSLVIAVVRLSYFLFFLFI